MTLPNLPNPKRDRASYTGRSGWYPYYAGFSPKFASSVLEIFCDASNPAILDPWNGSGTTTSVASACGYKSFGFDLNPVMTVVARARLLNKRAGSSLVPLAKSICNAKCLSDCADTDPLAAWFKPSAVSALRGIEMSLQSFLLPDVPKSMSDYIISNEISDLAAFYYVAMFRTIRTLLGKFQCSNPTWMKLPATPKNRLSPSIETISHAFLQNVVEMTAALVADEQEKDGKVHIGVASSTSVPLESETIDFVLTSPPYCTRIDYAAATRIELAMLGVGEQSGFETLRRSLLGTPTVPKVVPGMKESWGGSCLSLLKSVQTHPSKASATYYFKGLCSYFANLYASICEVGRCLRQGGMACIVVQDSYYKDLYIDLAKVCSEMGSGQGLEQVFRQDFVQSRTLATVNSKSKPYRNTSCATESALLFTKA